MIEQLLNSKTVFTTLLPQLVENIKKTEKEQEIKLRYIFYASPNKDDVLMDTIHNRELEASDSIRTFLASFDIVNLNLAELDLPPMLKAAIKMLGEDTIKGMLTPIFSGNGIEEAAKSLASFFETLEDTEDKEKIHIILSLKEDKGIISYASLTEQNTLKTFKKETLKVFIKNLNV